MDPTPVTVVSKKLKFLETTHYQQSGVTQNYWLKQPALAKAAK